MPSKQHTQRSYSPPPAHISFLPSAKDAYTVLHLPSHRETNISKGAPVDYDGAKTTLQDICWRQSERLEIASADVSPEYDAGMVALSSSGPNAQGFYTCNPVADRWAGRPHRVYLDETLRIVTRPCARGRLVEGITVTFYSLGNATSDGKPIIPQRPEMPNAMLVMLNDKPPSNTPGNHVS